MPRRLLLLPLLLLAGCAAPAVYVTHPKFSFQYPKDWEGPIQVPGGIEFLMPATRASMAIAFIPSKEAPFRDESSLRKRLAALASVEDNGQVWPMDFCDQRAYRTRYTTHYYDPEYLLGKKEHTLLTEATLVPYQDGLYLLRFQAPKTEFGSRKYSLLREGFLASVSLGGPDESILAATAVKAKGETSVESVSQRRSLESRRAKAEQFVNRTSTHQQDGARRRRGLLPFLQGPRGAVNRARGIDRLAVVSFVGDLTRPKGMEAETVLWQQVPKLMKSLLARSM